MSIDRAASRRYRSYRRHRNMWFVILGVLLVLLLTFGCVFAVRRAAHKKRRRYFRISPQKRSRPEAPELMKMWSW